MFNKIGSFSVLVAFIISSVFADNVWYGADRNVATYRAGNVGIGNSAPGDRLHVSGGNILLDNNLEIRFKNYAGTAKTALQLTGTGNTFNISNSTFGTNLWGSQISIGSGGSLIALMATQIYSNAIGIGAYPLSGQLLSVFGDATIRGAAWSAPGDKAQLNFGQGGHYIRGQYGIGVQIGTCGNTDIITIRDKCTGSNYDGNVGIGTIYPQYKLAVNGTIGAKEVIVTMTGWSDFVFKPDYNLKPLHEVEKFIQTNNHLEGIPTEKQVKADGIPVGEMQAKLLQKIEELTLYVIKQQKEIAELRATVQTPQTIR